MTRKKISDSDTNAAIVAELEPDEEFVVNTNTTKRVSREKRKPEPEAEREIVIDADASDEIDAEPVETFSPDSLAAMIYAEDEEPSFAETFCTIAVRRQPDGMGDSFATPCTTVTNLPRLPNVEITAERADVEDQVRREYGGGHYFFQIRTANGLGRAWKATLSDLPANRRPSNAEPTATPEPTIPTAAHVQHVDPVDSFLDNMRKQRELKEYLYGDEERRMREQIAAMQAKLDAQTNNAPRSDLETAVSLMRDADSDVKEIIRDVLLPDAGPEPKKGFVDLAIWAFENADKVIPVVGSVLSSFTGQAQPQPNVLQMLKAQPPAALPTPNGAENSPTAGASRFKRRSKAEPTPDESEIVKDAE